MKLHRVEIRNFRPFDEFTFEVDGRSVMIIGENAGGKSAVLTAIARAFARDLGFTGADFRDLQQPIEIHAVVRDFDVPQRGLFGNYIQFGPIPELTVGVRVVWDAASENAEVEHGYPSHPGSRSRRDEREGLPLFWLAADRDPARFLQFGAERNLMGMLLRGLPISQSLDQAADDVRQASDQLGQDAALAGLLRDARDALAGLIPDVAPNAYEIGVTALTARDLLRQFELQVEHLGPSMALSRQSSGIAQLSLFVYFMALAAAQPGIILLVDEPELSLHPQAQRAVMKYLREFDAQVICATHSSNVLDRSDPRDVFRLKHDAGGAVSVVAPSTLDDEEAHKLARYTSPHTAEGFFARKVVLVEGISDQYAVEAIAEKLGRNFDGEGVAVVPIGGATQIGTFLSLFGPAGFDVEVAGLCDEAEQHYFVRALQGLGLAVQDTNDLAQSGFFVCSADLEEELVEAVGVAEVEQLIDSVGDRGEFQRLQGQGAYQGVSLRGQILAFVRKHKIRYAPMLVNALDPADVPAPLGDLIAYL